MLALKFNRFFSTLNLILVLVGYEFTSTIFSLILGSVEQSRIITIPYHIFAVVICIITILFNINGKFNLHKISKLLFIYWGLLLLRFGYDMWMRLDVYVLNDIKFQYLMYMVPKTIFEMYAILKSYKNINFNKLFIWTYLFFAVSCIVTFFTNTSYQSATEERVDANVALGTIGAGHMGLSTLILSIYLLIYYKNSFLKKIIIILIGIISVYIWLRSGSRGPIFAFCGIAIFGILVSSKHYIRNILICISIAIGIYISLDYLLILLEKIAPVLYNRFIYFEDAESQFISRDYYYQYAIDSFLSHPMFGSCFAIYSMSGDVSYSHNMFLDTFMQLGLVGGLLFIYIIVRTIIQMIKFKQYNIRQFWLVLLLLQNMLKCTLSGAFYLEPIISILIIFIFIPRNIE